MTETSTTCCDAPGCRRSVVKRGYCDRHYQQVRRHGRLTPETEHGRKPVACKEPGCERTDVAARGLCWMHYTRRRRAEKAAEADRGEDR